MNSCKSDNPCSLAMSFFAERILERPDVVIQSRTEVGSGKPNFSFRMNCSSFDVRFKAIENALSACVVQNGKEPVILDLDVDDAGRSASLVFKAILHSSLSPVSYCSNNRDIFREDGTPTVNAHSNTIIMAVVQAREFFKNCEFQGISQYNVLQFIGSDENEETFCFSINTDCNRPGSIELIGTNPDFDFHFCQNILEMHENADAVDLGKSMIIDFQHVYQEKSDVFFENTAKFIKNTDSLNCIL